MTSFDYRILVMPLKISLEGIKWVDFKWVRSLIGQRYIYNPASYIIVTQTKPDPFKKSETQSAH